MIFFNVFFSLRRRQVRGFLFLLLVVCVSGRAYAVIEENAEQLDPFKQQDLQEFHDKLTAEEEEAQMLEAEKTLKTMTRLGKASKKAEAQGEALSKSEIEELRKKLLNVQKKDRWRFGLDGDHSYNSNNNGATPQHEKGDSQFNATANTQYNFGGKKTDMGIEVRGTKNWNIIASENDTWQGEERLRSRRKFFKKTNVSMNSRIARNSSKTLEIETNKIRWDASNQMATNFAFSRKLALNLDLATSKRLFLQEAFDQDSGWQATGNPSAFWNLSPKSRVSLGYGAGVNRNRLKAGNSDSKDVRIGYFGQITRKSSASIDLGVSQQDSFKSDSRSTSVTIGSGYIWQTTAKVQTSAQVTRGFSNTTSESVSGDTTDSAIVTKSDSYAINDNFALSLNYRMASKISLSMSSGISNTQTKSFVDDGLTSVAHIMTFPSSAGVNLSLTNWLTTNFTYSFSYKVGNEKTDLSRVHTIASSMNISF